MHASTHRIPETASHLHMNSALAFTELGKHACMHACMGACTFLKVRFIASSKAIDGFCAAAAYDKTCSCLMGSTSSYFEIGQLTYCISFLLSQLDRTVRIVSFQTFISFTENLMI